MGITKTDIYDEQTLATSAYLKVMGHPARIKILQHLQETENCICGDLVDTIGLSQPTISQHLKELKNIGLIQGTVEGSRVCYCINQEEWNHMVEVISPLINQINTNKSNCC